MRPTFEKLVPSAGESFRCFDRSALRSPVKWHRHPEIELTYIESGTGSRLVGDHIGSYRDHDLVLIGSDLPHTWASDAFRGKKYDRHPAIVTQFHPDFLGKSFFNTVELAPIADLFQRASRGLFYPAEVARQIGKRMSEMLELQGAARLIGLLTCLHELSVAEGIPLSSEGFRLRPNKDVESRIQTVCDYIAQHLSDEDLSHSVLADLVYMNPSAFSRFFKQSTGRTVSAHITELRIGLACRLLVDTDDSILGVSQSTGFSNLSNFNRHFRKLRGMTPRDYRSRYSNALQG